MQLHGIHHITAITADAQQNVDFYAGLLGLRFVKKTVNFDDPTAYHLYYGDERGTPGSILTFFEYPGAARGQRRRRHDPPPRVARRRRGRARLLAAAAAGRRCSAERGSRQAALPRPGGARARASPFAVQEKLR